jgi:(p)ppGpp synthase/HD superfamily hydrolase
MLSRPNRNTVTPVVSSVDAALSRLALKEMDAALLSYAILHESGALGVDPVPLTEAMKIAAYVHRDDRRAALRDGVRDPYIVHPFRLVLRLVRYGCADPAVLAAAALHDTVEDHPDDVVALFPADSALDALVARFGPDVAGLVAAVTNPPTPPGVDRQDHYHEHVARIVADPRVFLIKIADFVDNAGSLRHLADGPMRARLEGRYAPLVPVYRAALATHEPTLADRLPPTGLARLTKHLTRIAHRLPPSSQVGRGTDSGVG